MADLDLDALERATREHVSREPQMEDTIMSLIARLRSAEAEVDTAQAAERKAHDAIARNDERHAEAIAAVRGRAERAERERDEAMHDGGLDLVRRAVVRAESAEKERDEARAERDAAILARDGARDEAWQSEVDGCKRALHEREARIRAEEDHRAAVESLETYEDRIKDIAAHVLGIQPPDVATIVLLDAIERRCGEERIAARQAEARVAELEEESAMLLAPWQPELEALRAVAEAARAFVQASEQISHVRADAAYTTLQETLYALAALDAAKEGT